MKLSALLAPLFAAKIDHETILKAIVAYEEQQSDALARRRESDAKRQAEKREKAKVSRDVTLRHSDRLLVTRVEDSSSNLEISGKERKIDASPSAQPKRGERLPENFQPDIQWAISQGLSASEAETEAAQFRDFWRGKPGKDGLKLDWPGTWRMWVRNYLKRRSQPARAGPSRKRNYVDVAKDRWSEGNGSAGVFGDHGNVEFLPPRKQQPGSDDEHLRSGLARRFIAGSS